MMKLYNSVKSNVFKNIDVSSESQDNIFCAILDLIDDGFNALFGIKKK